MLSNEPSKTGKSTPAVVLCVGQDAKLREEKIQSLTQALILASAASVDLVTFHTADLEPALLIEAVRTAPFLSDRRVVVVRGVLDRGRQSLEWLEQIISDPPKTACLIVEFLERPKIDLKGPRGLIQMETCDLPRGQGAVVAWIKGRMQTQHKKRLSPQALEALTERLGEDCQRLAQALEQLALFTEDRPEVRPEDVTALLGYSVEHRTFDVVDCALAQDRVKALRITRRLVEEEGVSPVELLGALGAHVRRLWQVAKQVDQGASLEVAAQSIRMPFSAKRAFVRVARQMPLERATEILQMLLDADLKLKSSKIPQTAIVESCVWELAGGVSQAGRLN